MIQSSYDWQVLPHFSDDSFLKIAKKYAVDEKVAKLLYQRGVQTEAALESFLQPSLEDLHDPYLLQDMEKAVARIRRAIEDYETILIYGDYDADGMTSASILKEALEELGAEVQVYLPNRFTDGYGPNQSVYRYFIEEQGVSLIVTVDNGVAGHEAIAYAQEQGVDVVVTDHHSLQETLPSAYAILHPEHPEGAYPFSHLAGCGVAFKLACALLEHVPVELLDLVAIGTIADMVSLTDENRVMVKYGLSLLKETERIGIQELYQLAGIEPAQLDEETIGFQIAPRLNALGRLDDPNPAVELLTGFDEEEIHHLARMVDDKNSERKELVQTIYEQAKAMVDKQKTVQVVAKEGWNPGVLGIVAGRLLEDIGQPVIVLSIDGERAKGSARSVAAVDIFEALQGHPDLFLAFGGHAGAAGMTLEVNKLPDLEEKLIAYVAQHQLDSAMKPSLVLDEELDLADLHLDTLKSFARLAPYGMDNKKPVFYLPDVQVVSARTMGQGNAHLKLRIEKNQQSVEVIAFDKGAFLLEFSQAKQLDLAVTLSVNQWNGHTSLQLMLVDARVEGVQLYNLRGKQHPIPPQIPILDFTVPLPDLTGLPAVVVTRLPEQLEEMKAVFQRHSFEAIYFKNELATPDYLDGYASREQFAKLYKTLYRYKEFDVRYKLTALADYLRIKEHLLIKMIHIFQELGFVTITDGVMRVNPDAPKREIGSSQIYQDWKEQVKTQELMALGTVQEIYAWLTNKDVEE